MSVTDISDKIDSDAALINTFIFKTYQENALKVKVLDGHRGSRRHLWRHEMILTHVYFKFKPNILNLQWRELHLVFSDLCWPHVVISCCCRLKHSNTLHWPFNTQQVGFMLSRSETAKIKKYINKLINNLCHSLIYTFWVKYVFTATAQ